MGFSNLFAAALAFSVLMGIFYVLNERLPGDVVDMQAELDEQYGGLVSDARTDFSVRSIVYYSENTLLACTLGNTGGEILDPEGLSLIVGGTYLDETIYPVARLLPADTSNPGLWDPDEELQLNATIDLDEGDQQIKFFYLNGLFIIEEVSVANSSMNWTVTQADGVEGDVDSSCEIIEIGATEDDDYIYLRVNVTGEISSDCVYNLYLDLDGDGGTGLEAEGNRTLLLYPNGSTSLSDVGIEYLVSFRDSSAILYTKRDLTGALEEDRSLTYMHPSPSTLLVRIEPSDLGFSPSDTVSFYFYAYAVDDLRRVDYSPNP